jgi:hypothetical protein
MKYPEVKSPLVTVFQKIDNKKWIPVKRYRRYRVATVDEMIEELGITIGSPKSKGVSISKTECPGCHQTLSRLAINETHECTGDTGTVAEQEEFTRQVQLNRALIRMDCNSRIILRKLLPPEEFERIWIEHTRKSKK